MAAAMAHRVFASRLLLNVCWIASPSRRVTAAEIQPGTFRNPKSSSRKASERSIGGRTMIVSKGLSEGIVRGMAIHSTRFVIPLKPTGLSLTDAIRSGSLHALFLEATIRDDEAFRGPLHKDRIRG